MFWRIFALVGCCLSVSLTSSAQTANDIMAGAYVDLIKTDNITFFGKSEDALEVNYFVFDQFSASAAVELWTPKQFNFVPGVRWYPVDDAFIRVRGLLGENDISIGAGWVKPINDQWKFESIGDFYFSVDFAIRVGIVYVIE